MMKKRLLSSLLALVMCLSLSVSAWAFEESKINQGNDFESSKMSQSYGKVVLSERTSRDISDKLYLATFRGAYSYYAANYTHNTSLTQPNGYIMGQNSYSSFRLGAASFKNVGCEVAATYNALRAIGRQPTLPSIIRTFEKYGYILVEGLAGSDPFAIANYFDSAGVNYVQYAEKASYSSFKNKVASNDSNVLAYIVSFWTNDTKTALHTVMFTVDSSGHLHTYNRYDSDTTSQTINSLDNFGVNFTSKFIVGYAVCRDNRSING